MKKSSGRSGISNCKNEKIYLKSRLWTQSSGFTKRYTAYTLQQLLSHKEMNLAGSQG